MQFTGSLQAPWLGPSALFLHSSRELDDLSQCFNQDASTIKIIVFSIITVIIISINKTITHGANT